jgi:hypothetical protein
MYWLNGLPQSQALPPSGNFGPGNTIVYQREVNGMEEGSDRHIKTKQLLTFSMTRKSPAYNPEMITSVQQRPIYRRA